MKYFCELTDSFGGEANYSWARRETIELRPNHSHQELVIAAKDALGITGVRCTKNEIGGTIELRPVGQCLVAFIAEID